MGNFFTRYSIYAIALSYMLSPVRLSVRPSHGWIIQKRLKLGTKFSPHSSSIPLVFRQQVSSRNSEWFPRSGALNEGGIGKIGDFRTLSRHTPKPCKIGLKLLLINSRNMYKRFPLVPKAMTLSDP